MSQVEEKLKQMGYALPTPPSPMANYIPGYRAGNLVFLSGVTSRRSEGTTVTGKLGKDLTVEQGYEAARLCALNLLANLKTIIGDLDKVKRVAKLLCMINSTPDFVQQPLVANGATDLLSQLYGDAGAHARSAVGMGSLPNAACIEIEMILEVED